MCHQPCVFDTRPTCLPVCDIASMCAHPGRTAAAERRGSAGRWHLVWAGARCSDVKRELRGCLFRNRRQAHGSLEAAQHHESL